MKAKLGGAALLVLQLSAHCWAYHYRTVVLTGEAAQGTTAGITFSGFSNPAINDAGQVAFHAEVTGPGVSHTNPETDSGLWSEGGGMLRKLVRSGDAAPFVSPPSTFSGSGDARINAAGRSAFNVFIRPGGQQAIYSEGTGSLELVAVSGQQAPGMAAGITFDEFSSEPVLNELGQTAFTSVVDDPSTSDVVEGLWTNREGPLTLVARTGDVMPGTSAILESLGLVLLNDAGRIAFQGTTSGLSIFGDQAAWTDAGGTLTEVARKGGQASGFPSGVTYQFLSSLDIDINNAGHLAFSGPISGPGVVAGWASGRDLSAPTVSWFRVATRRRAAPRGRFSQPFRTKRLMAPAVFRSPPCLPAENTTDANDLSVWRELGSSFELVAREGSQAPGSPPGVVFDDFNKSGGPVGPPFANTAGQLAFPAHLKGPGVSSASNLGIWVTDLAGHLVLVAREGDLFDVNDDPLVDDFRTIRTVDIARLSTAGEDGRESALNDLGQLVIALSFTDSTAGVFVFETAVPEPASAMLMAMAFIASFSVARRGIDQRNLNRLVHGERS